MTTAEKTREEKHRDAMRNFRKKQKLKERVDIRLGWGTKAEHETLKAMLVSLRDTQAALAFEKTTEDVRPPPVPTPIDNFSAAEASDTLGPSVVAPGSTSDQSKGGSPAQSPDQVPPPPPKPPVRPKSRSSFFD
jgi:hypothetical protein